VATNVLTNLGEEWVVDRLIGTSGTYSTAVGAHVGWGTGAGASAKADTSLFTESTDPGSAARIVGAITKAGSPATGSTALWQNVATVPSTTTQTITNAGCFNGQSAGAMFIKGDFTGIPLSNGDSIQFTFTLNPS
jgi:hypothetical protein